MTFAWSQTLTLGGIGILIGGVGALLSGWAAIRLTRKSRNNNGNQPKEKP